MVGATGYLGEIAVGRRHVALAGVVAPPGHDGSVRLQPQAVKPTSRDPGEVRVGRRHSELTVRGIPQDYDRSIGLEAHAVEFAAGNTHETGVGAESRTSTARCSNQRSNGTIRT